MRQLLRWFPFAVIGMEAALMITGVIDFREAAIALLVLEVCLAAVVGAEFVILWRAYRDARRADRSRVQSLSAAIDVVLPTPVAFLVRQESRLFVALLAALRRHREVPAGGRAITYGGALRVLLIGMVAVSIVELAVVELVVPWPVLRWVFLILGGYALLWVCGFGASVYSRPHVAGVDELRLRFAIFADIAVPLAGPVQAQQALRGSHQRLLEITDDGELAVSVMGSTNVVVRLGSPQEVHLGRRGRHRIHRVRFYADEPVRAAELLRTPPSVR